MSQFVPVATHVYESSIINASIEQVWSTLTTPLDFSWWELVQSASLKVWSIPLTEVESLLISNHFPPFLFLRIAW